MTSIVWVTYSDSVNISPICKRPRPSLVVEREVVAPVRIIAAHRSVMFKYLRGMLRKVIEVKCRGIASGGSFDANAADVNASIVVQVVGSIQALCECVEVDVLAITREDAVIGSSIDARAWGADICVGRCLERICCLVECVGKERRRRQDDESLDRIHGGNDSKNNLKIK